MARRAARVISVVAQDRRDQADGEERVVLHSPRRGDAGRQRRDVADHLAVVVYITIAGSMRPTRQENRDSVRGSGRVRS